jgi:hypothetical protein
MIPEGEYHSKADRNTVRLYPTEPCHVGGQLNVPRGESFPLAFRELTMGISREVEMLSPSYGERGVYALSQDKTARGLLSSSYPQTPNVFTSRLILWP